jgi:hypothetical protein
LFFSFKISFLVHLKVVFENKMRNYHLVFSFLFQSESSNYLSRTSEDAEEVRLERLFERGERHNKATAERTGFDWNQNRTIAHQVGQLSRSSKVYQKVDRVRRGQVTGRRVEALVQSQSVSLRKNGRNRVNTVSNKFI